MPKRIGLNTEPDPIPVPAPAPTPIPSTPAPVVETKPGPQPASSFKFPVEPEILRQIGDRLSAFVAMPKNVKFQDENDDETIILLLRAHLITNVPWIAITILMILAPIFLFPFLFMTNVFPSLPAGFKFVSLIFWYLATFTYTLVRFLSWYFNVYIVTDERVVDVDWYSIIYRRVTTAQMSKIQDVSNTIGGVIRSVFDFGNVHIETAGELENIEFENIPHPALVAKQIEHLMQHEETEWETKPTP